MVSYDKKERCFCMTDSLQQLKAMLDRAGRIAFLGGAGLSTDIVKKPPLSTTAYWRGQTALLFV